MLLFGVTTPVIHYILPEVTPSVTSNAYDALLLCYCSIVSCRKLVYVYMLTIYMEVK